MGRSPCCDKNGLKKGPWTTEEDTKLIQHIQMNGPGNWRTLPKTAGLQRCGKSCRLRWTNYLRPDIKRGRFSFEEEETIIQLHSVLGNKWSAIAARLPGRTDNEIKNYWNTHIRKRLLRNGIDPVTHAPRLDLLDLSSQINLSNLLRLQTLLNPEALRLAMNLVSPDNDLNSDILLNSHQLHRNQATIFQANQFENIITQEIASIENQNFGYMQEQIGHFTVNTTNQLFQENLDPTIRSLPNIFNGISHDQMKADLSDNSTFDQSLNTSCSNNNSQNFSFDNSVLSTPLCSPPPPNSAFALSKNGKVDEMESFCSDLLRFEIPEGLDFDDFM